MRVTILLLYATPDTLHFQLRKKSIVAAGKYARLGTPGAFFEIQRAGEEPYSESVGPLDHRAALRALIDYLQRNKHVLAVDDILAVVHRIPHGGRAFGTSVRLNHDAAIRLEETLRAHHELPAATHVVNAALRQLPNAQHIGVFAGGIYRDMPRAHHAAAVDAHLNAALERANPSEDGLWHEAAYQTALALLGNKKTLPGVSVHVGVSVSITALEAGKAVASAGGTAASASLPGLRSSGAIDPGVALSIAESLDVETWRVAELLAERSGLAAMTGKDSYALIEAGARAGDKRCVEALMLLAYRIAFVVEGMRAAIGAPRLLVFSGEGASWTLIEEVCRRLPEVRLRAAKGRPNAILSEAGCALAVAWIEHTPDEALLVLARPHLPESVRERDLVLAGIGGLKGSRRKKRAAKKRK